MNKRTNKTKRLVNILLAGILSLSLAFSLNTVPAKAAYQNPPLAEIAEKFERVGLEKNIPPVILKAIAYPESGWRQFDSNGNVVLGGSRSHPYIGIMQVGSYNGTDTDLVNKLKHDIDFNIAYGADLLNAKWDMVPKIGDGDKNKLENWYFAIWAYNSWSTRNNPNNAAAAGRTAYQDKILNYAASDFFPGLIDPVRITPVPANSIPYGTLPANNSNWETPTPIHYMEEAEPVIELPAGFTRIGGETRIDTAVRIAETGWPYGSNSVIIARADDFPDALAGAALAKQKNAPILLTPAEYLDNRVIEALEQLKPLQVIMLGGEGALSIKVENKLKEVLYWIGEEDFERIAGQNRYETAALIASRFPTEQGIALAAGSDFPDALSLAAAAAAEGIPLVLTEKNHLPPVSKEFIQKAAPTQIYIAGGSGAVSQTVEQESRQVSGLGEEAIQRFAGSNRYQTSVLIAKYFYTQKEKLYLATGTNFPDALAGAALAAKEEAPLLLLSPQGVQDDSELKNYLELQENIADAQVFGGSGVLPNKLLAGLKEIIDKIKI